MTDEIDNVTFNMELRRTGNSHRLIQCYVNMAPLLAYTVSINPYIVSGLRLTAELRSLRSEGVLCEAFIKSYS